MMKFAGYLATFLGGLVTCYLLLSLGVVDRVDGLPGAQQEPMLSLPTYLSFVSVLLTAVTVVLTAVAVGIGLVAAMTFSGLKNEARSSSEKTSKEVSEATAASVAASTAQKVVEDALSEVKVKAMVDDLYAKAEKEREQEKEWGVDTTDNEDR